MFLRISKNCVSCAPFGAQENCYVVIISILAKTGGGDYSGEEKKLKWTRP